MLKAAVTTSAHDARQRNIPALRAIALRMQVEPYRIHPAISKTVYISPLQRIGRIRGVHTGKAIFVVEHGGKSDWSTFPAKDLVAM